MVPRGAYVVLGFEPGLSGARQVFKCPDYLSNPRN